MNQFGALLLVNMIISTRGPVCILVRPRASYVSRNNVPLALKLRVERWTYGGVSVCTRSWLTSDFRGPSGILFSSDGREADFED